MARPHGTSIEWFPRTLPHATQQALGFFSKQTWLKKTSWYLAGGTAMALQAGHRPSVDLDFFTAQNNFSTSKLIAHFPVSAWKTDIIDAGTLYGKLHGAKISFISYPFFIAKQKPLAYGNINVLDIRDIAIMKIIAISQRGRKRDFIDLFWYVTNKEPLIQVLKRLPEQYPTIAHDYYHILKAMNYFSDADEDPMPKIFFKATWKEIKKTIQSEVSGATRQLLNLR